MLFGLVQIVGDDVDDQGGFQFFVQYDQEWCKYGMFQLMLWCEFGVIGNVDGRVLW